MGLKSGVRSVWEFFWEEESWLSWFANLVLAFVVIKYLVYPALGLLLGTSFPIVAVVSGSMEHDSSFEDWWDTVCVRELTENVTVTQGDIYSRFDISEEDFREFDFKNGFNKGDLMVLMGPGNAGKGDVIVFMADHRNDPIIHRAIQVKEVDGTKIFKTKGDNNCAIAPFEEHVSESRTVGKAVLRIPLLGWVKIGFVNLIGVIWNVLS